MNTESKELLQKILRQNGHSITTARLSVCDLLWDKEPQTMAELARNAIGTLDRASLYRTISLYEQLGIVQRIYIGWKYKIELSDIFTHHHHHISCLQCGKVSSITEEDAIEKLITEIATKHGFIAQQHQLEVRGYCKTCASTNSI